MIKNKRLFGAAAVVAASLSGQSAYAQCSANGGPAAFADLVDFAGGAAINSAIAVINATNTAFLTQTNAFIGSPANPRPNQEGGGVWTRGVGGEFETKNQGVGTFAINGAPLAGNVACDTRTRLSYAGFQVGSDAARLNWNGWNIHIGGTAGYLSSRGADRTLAGPLNGAGTSTGTIDVPFAGVYAAATYGGFYVDGQVRWDYYSNTVSNAAGIFRQGFNGHGVSFTGNVGYNMQLGNNWFIEPSAGIVVSQTKFDSISTSGGQITGISPLPAGSLLVDPINSTLGRVSLRAGTNIDGGSVIWQPFAIASVFHDFERGATGTVNVPVGGSVVDARIATSSLGTYGQYGVGVAGQLVGTGWLGYVRGDYRNGNNIEGYGVNAGLRYQFQPDAAPRLHKGMIAKAPVAVASAVNWTGFYVGGNVGAANGDADFRATAPNGDIRNRFAGVIGGVHAGYNYQVSQWVLGVEGSFSGANATGARNCSAFPFIYNCEADLNWLATATARLGYAMWDRSFVYAKGGLAVGDTDSRVRCNTGSFPVLAVGLPLGCPVATQNNTRVGWTIGGGSEFALNRNWSVKGETMYFDLGRETFAPGAVIGMASEKTTGFQSTVGVSYRFN